MILHNCYNCGTRLEKNNKSLEHIIPNSIGGKLKSSSLLCRKCNNHFGETIDAELGKQFNNLVVFLNLNRDRDKDYVIKNVIADSGKKYNLIDGILPVRVGYNPIVKEIRNTKETLFKIEARDLNHANQIIKGLSRKYPSIKEGGYLLKMKKIEAHVGDLRLNMSVGGEEIYRAIGKIAINLYLHFGGKKQNIEPLLKVVNGIEKNVYHIHHYPIIKGTIFNGLEVSHNIFIKSCSKRKILYAYIILFSYAAFVVNLCDDYQGDDFFVDYCYDVLEQKSVNRTSLFDYCGRRLFVENLDINFAEISNAIIKSTQANLRDVLLVADYYQTKKVFDDILNKWELEIKKIYPSFDFSVDEIPTKIKMKRDNELKEFFDHVKNRAKPTVVTNVV